MSFHERTKDAARGKWVGILQEFGLPSAALKNRHGPCPICGHKENFRWDNKDGSGSYICTCGAGDGLALAMAYTGQGFAETAARIDGLLGNVKPDAPSRPSISDEDRLSILRRAYAESRAIEVGDPVHRYLASRHIDELVYPKALRFHPRLLDGDGRQYPAMIAMVGVPGEPKFCSMHRTFLRPDGTGKAEMERPKKLMPGSLPDGACVALSEFHGGKLGIAEGIETAMSASALFEMPVWAAISSAMLAKWRPPEGCEEVAIFADNDQKFGGQAAAFALAHRLSTGRVAVPVTVHVPDRVGEDWADVYLRSKGVAA